ncbi:MAG TPA: SUMF1/EgtB/PvdO family nonheme iron enzyme [Polyangiaceae bacterium]|jgi:formylglycine-generating enzyme required for sulfatase activity
MNPTPARTAAASIVATAVAVAVMVAIALRGRDERARCGAGFVARGARCLVPDPSNCPVPLVSTPRGCDAPDRQIEVPATSLLVGPSDWEAEGRISARAIRVEGFRVDAFEVTRGRWGAAQAGRDAGRAASAMTRDEAAAFCASRGGRLPTEDEWIVAAASAANPPRRYPWGDTGAVCRRAAWGLAEGPCARDGEGADTVGAHPDGDSPWGLHDLAGNVAEWVAPDARRPETGVAKGGSWASSLATDLRVWARLELSPDARDPRVGVRCAYSLRGAAPVGPGP